MRNRPFASLKVIIPLVALCLVLANSTANADDWLIYRKPAYSGQILDGETKEPIEGAVVVALYYKRSLNLLGAGNFSSVIEIKETLTDKKGRFNIPKYTTIIDPLSYSQEPSFFIYKPGYVPVDQYSIAGLHNLFSGRYLNMNDFKVEWRYNKNLYFNLRKPNIVELPKPTSMEEKIRSLPFIPGPDLPAKKMENLIRYSNEERGRLGFGEERFK